MPLGTLDRTPPPFFRQGPSALTKLILCSALALFLMVADNRFAVTRQLRAVVATALYYPQQALLVPVTRGRCAISTSTGTMLEPAALPNISHMIDSADTPRRSAWPCSR